MYIIIVGGGPIGVGLAETAIQEHHNVVLIEANEGLAEAASRSMDALVLRAPITESGILEEANANEADALIAVTDDDAVNLMAVALAKEYGIQELMSVVHTEEHRGAFERLGARVMIAPETLVARRLYSMLQHPGIEDVIPLTQGAQAFVLRLSSTSPLVGKTLAEAAGGGLLPGELLIVAIMRDEETIIPRSETMLHAGDQLTVFARTDLDPKQVEIFKA